MIGLGSDKKNHSVCQSYIVKSSRVNSIIALLLQHCQSIVRIERDAPFWNVWFPYGHCLLREGEGEGGWFGLVWSTFFTSKWAISSLRGKSKRLPGWYVHFLAYFGNVKKQMKNSVRIFFSFTKTKTKWPPVFEHKTVPVVNCSYYHFSLFFHFWQISLRLIVRCSRKSSLFCLQKSDAF